MNQKMLEPKHPRMIRNVLSLYSVQGLQYLIPLLTLPWLLRCIGLQGFGILSLAGAYAAYSQVICDYGFALSATHRIAKTKDSKTLSSIVSSIIAAKITLSLFANVIICISIYSINSTNSLFPYVVLSCINSTILSFFPSWIFQGKETMGTMSIISAITKITQLLLIFLLINKSSNISSVIYINIATSFFATASAWVAAFILFDIRIVPPKIHGIIFELHSGFEIFISQIGSLFMANSSIIALGFFASKESIGAYSLAEKIIRMIAYASGPLGTAIFPRMSTLIIESRTSAFEFIYKIGKIGSIFFSTVSVVLFFGADLIINIASGKSNEVASTCLRVMCTYPLWVFLDNIFGTQILLNLGEKRKFMYATLSAGILSIAFQIIFTASYGAIGSAIATLATQLWLLAFFAISFLRIRDNADQGGLRGSPNI